MEKIALLSLASDLKRICQSIQRGSSSNSQKFTKEATRWLVEAKKTHMKSIAKLLPKVERTLKQKDNFQKAETCLMYSVLIQNRAMLLR